MAENLQTYLTTFQVKRGTDEDWRINNPELQPGELGYAIDTNILKIGGKAIEDENGNLIYTRWNDLNSINSEIDISKLSISWGRF